MSDCLNKKGIIGIITFGGQHGATKKEMYE